MVAGDPQTKGTDVPPEAWFHASLMGKVCLCLGCKGKDPYLPRGPLLPEDPPPPAELAPFLSLPGL